MANTVWLAPTANYVQTTLNGAITDSATTITLNSTTNLTAPGYVVIDRTDSSGTASPNAREVVSFTGISGSDITGCTRGADGSTNRSHSNGAIVETMPTVGMWNSLATIVGSGFNGDGYLKPLVSPASISILSVKTRLEVSGASITGIGLHPTWYIPGFASGASTNVMRLVMPQSGNFQFFTMTTRTPVSTASLTLDVNKNGTSIFDTIGRINILGGGTFASTASIATKNFIAGDVVTVDVDTGGNVADITLTGRAA